MQDNETDSNGGRASENLRQSVVMGMVDKQRRLEAARRKRARAERRFRRKLRRGLLAVAVLLVILCLALLISHLNAGEPAAPPAQEVEQPKETAAVEEKSPARRLLEQMTLREKVYQMFFVTPEELIADPTRIVVQTGETSIQAIQTCPVGGIIYFTQNLESAEQVKTMIEGLQSASRLGLFIGIDEEGGAVSRAGKNPALGISPYPPMSEIGASGDSSQAYQVGYTLGTELSGLGFNLDFAPVADVFSNPENKVIGDRAFGSDPLLVSDMTASAVRGFRESGILCVAKHFPGHGDTATDSHKGPAYTYKTLEELESTELLPFQTAMAVQVPFIMVGHISAPNLTGDDTPASLSASAIKILKEMLGYGGLVISDSLSMGAIANYYTPGEAAVMAVQAGEDMILMPEELEAAAEAVLTAVENGTVSEERINESVEKILDVKLQWGVIRDGM